jgi:two-component system alkaline phosphatase synthesis response regulator PhoP
MDLNHVTDALQARGYSVATRSNSEFSLDPAFAADFDLILIDHSEPEVNALDICAGLRRREVEAPVIVFAPPNPVQQRIAIFNAGADDYLLKPVDLDELQTRVERLLARVVRMRKSDVFAYEFGPIRVDFREAELARNGSVIELTERESRLLRYFVENRGKTISRNALLQHVWGYNSAPLTRTVDVHVLRLRHKIENDPKRPRFIITVPGLGYRFDG